MNRILKFDPPEKKASSLDMESPTSDTSPSCGTNKALWHNMEPYQTFDDILLEKAYVKDKFPQFKNVGKRKTGIPHG